MTTDKMTTQRYLKAFDNCRPVGLWGMAETQTPVFRRCVAEVWPVDEPKPCTHDPDPIFRASAVFVGQMITEKGVLCQSGDGPYAKCPYQSNRSAKATDFSGRSYFTGYPDMPKFVDPKASIFFYGTRKQALEHM